MSWQKCFWSDHHPEEGDLYKPMLLKTNEKWEAIFCKVHLTWILYREPPRRKFWNLINIDKICPQKYLFHLPPGNVLEVFWQDFCNISIAGERCLQLPVSQCYRVSSSISSVAPNKLPQTVATQKLPKKSASCPKQVAPLSCSQPYLSSIPKQCLVNIATQ